MNKVIEKTHGNKVKHRKPVDIKLSDTDLGFELGKREIIILVVVSTCAWIAIVLLCGVGCYAYQKNKVKKDIKNKQEVEIGEISASTIPSATDESRDDDHNAL